MISVVSDARISALVSARERHQAARGGRPAARDLQLMAPGVELSTRIAVSGVQGDDLVAHEVVSGLDARGNRVRGAGIAADHQRGIAPDAGGSRAARLRNLEPDGRRSGQVVLTASVRASRHVRDDWAHVRVGPECPVECDGRSSGDGGVERCGLAAGDATGCVSVALQVNQGDVLDGSIAGDGT